MAGGLRIGIDLGGTKTEGMVLDVSGKELGRLRVPTPQGDYEASLRVIAGIVDSLEAAHGTAGTVGVGMPGIVSPATGLVKNANSTWLNGRPLLDDLRHRLRQPVKVANDANCFAVSEAVDGAARGAAVVFGVILGTGVGGGIVVNGQVLTGANAIAGEWGHNFLPWPTASEMPGPECYCGRRGCIETYLSGPALARQYAGKSGTQGDAGELPGLADCGDLAAEAVLKDYEHRLARALASVINLLDPDVIVLGGGLSNLQRLYTAVPTLWEQWVFSDRTDTRLVQNHHGDSSGVRGAAWL